MWNAFVVRLVVANDLWLGMGHAQGVNLDRLRGEDQSKLITM